MPAKVLPLGENCYLRPMRSEAWSHGTAAAKPRDGGLAKRMLTAGDGWSVREVICRAGPADRPFEERHEGFSVSAVMEGSFTYRSDAGHDLLYPGALLLGNSGGCFECGHAHGVGDRCISLNVRDDLFGEIAAAASSTRRFRFSAPSLPPSPEALPVVAAMEALISGAPALRGEELALRVIERVVGAMADRKPLAAAPAAREARRVIDAIRLVESDSARRVRLKDLAASAGMSRYHFLRVFRRLVGMTPYQYLLSARMRRAAFELGSTRRPVLEIALDSGFGDLSTFNHRFRATFRQTPTQYRASACSRALSPASRRR
jgi:AraC family transcriptional regulator